MNVSEKLNLTECCYGKRNSYNLILLKMSKRDEMLKKRKSPLKVTVRI